MPRTHPRYAPEYCAESSSWRARDAAIQADVLISVAASNPVTNGTVRHDDAS
jgi:hypothetical protein